MKSVTTRIAPGIPLCFSLAVVSAGEVSIPHEFVAGEAAVAAQVNKNFNAVKTGVNDNHDRLAALESAIALLQTRVTDLETENAILKANIESINTTDSSQDSRLVAIEGNSVMALDGILTTDIDINGYPAAYFSGINLYVNNGSGTTSGTPNGSGNLVVGYNELRGAGDNRGGSHNLVVGQQNNYSSYGGVVAGYVNEISSYYSSVLGGRLNKASGDSSTINGGSNNQTTGYCSVINGGRNNISSGSRSTISGGRSNDASGDYASIFGGVFHMCSDATPEDDIDDCAGSKLGASGLYSTVVGGLRLTANGQYSTAVGGSSNAAYGNYSTALGGLGNRAGNDSDPPTGSHSVVVGGRSGTASGSKSVVVGGSGLTETDDYDVSTPDHP